LLPAILCDEVASAQLFPVTASSGTLFNRGEDLRRFLPDRHR
jgi:hypothetical protein